MIRIGDLAKRAKISKRTLHYYEQIGLLPPSIVMENGYRYYDDDSVLRLQKILLLKSIGYTLEQIKQLLQDRQSAQEKENWAASFDEQIEFIERKKAELDRKQYYLRAAAHVIRLSGTRDAEDLLQVIEALEDRPLVDGVVPAEFGDDLPFTSEEKNILNRLPVLGSEDKRMEEMFSIFHRIKAIMPASPHSPEAQAAAGRLYELTLDLFEGDEELAQKYGDLIKPAPGEKPVVMGMDSEFVAYLDEMIEFFLKERKGNRDEEQ
ncbi:MerR family transcriptional regulator [Saccharibacillus sp. CPCC 101409]|uniref:MerR family transcriptional regulator n=1 Tax=Saccharibacillus sp. CPCC 101409 TaxID=3058041 RepID=UPI002672C622|nr:MerR family transcriptional regulator [Saccharibacillus sp. CPCC 101409]MDO3410557.1 MerR family transcriptional regulator [Saccharibacillus sp. CPCC 101409]